MFRYVLVLHLYPGVNFLYWVTHYLRVINQLPGAFSLFSFKGGSMIRLELAFPARSGLSLVYKIMYTVDVGDTRYIDHILAPCAGFINPVWKTAIMLHVFLWRKEYCRE